MSRSLGTLTQEVVRQTFDYVPETGRLVRIRRGVGARTGVEIGSVEPASGHRRAHFGGKNRMTAHLVWIWHRGEMPAGILKHKNGVNSDDRIENLQLLKKQLPIAFTQSGVEVCEYGRLPAEIISGIYEIQCTKNGRRYVGSAVNFSARWHLHYTQLCAGKHHSRHLQRAWNKYGEDAFVFRVLESCERQELIVREQHYIDSLKPEFNARPNAASQLGWTPTEETRKKMRESRAGKSSAMKGRQHTPEAIARMSESRKGKGGGPCSEERRLSIARGAFRTKSKLTEESIREGRRLKALGLSVPQVAARIGCGVYAAYDFLGGRTFGWVK